MDRRAVKFVGVVYPKVEYTNKMDERSVTYSPRRA